MPVTRSGFHLNYTIHYYTNNSNFCVCLLAYYISNKAEGKKLLRKIAFFAAFFRHFLCIVVLLLWLQKNCNENNNFSSFGLLIKCYQIHGKMKKRKMWKRWCWNGWNLERRIFFWNNFRGRILQRRGDALNVSFDYPLKASKIPMQTSIDTIPPN